MAGIKAITTWHSGLGNPDLQVISFGWNGLRWPLSRQSSKLFVLLTSLLLQAYHVDLVPAPPWQQRQHIIIPQLFTWLFDSYLDSCHPSSFIMNSTPSWDWHSAEDYLPPTPPMADPIREEPARPATPPQPPVADPAGPRRRRYGPRTCRICLDSEQPMFPESWTTFGISSTSSRPQYVSDDPELGRLLSPCKCKGTQKYVHQGCLNAWRQANSGANRNFWNCPTCGFTYRMARLRWASMLSSRWTQVIVTIFILFMTVFILGFMADPILDLWFDPVGTISDTVASVVTDIEAMEQTTMTEPTTWLEHFTKGFVSLGLVGFLKSMVVMSPWHWWNLRGSGLVGTGRRQGTGRDRMEQMNLAVVILGAFTFLMGTWKVVKALTARVLKRVSDIVIDVDADDEDELEEETAQKNKKDE